MFEVHGPGPDFRYWGWRWKHSTSHQLSGHFLDLLCQKWGTLWWTNIAMERSTIFHGNIHYQWPFSIAMLVHQRVPCKFQWFINWQVWTSISEDGHFTWGWQLPRKGYPSRRAHCSWRCGQVRHRFRLRDVGEVEAPHWPSPQRMVNY